MERTFKVIAENGIHARPATNLVNLAMRFESDIWLVANDRSVDMKSIMGVMSLGIYKAAKFTVRVKGYDAEEALEAISALLFTENLGIVVNE
ncbi:phosphocarrier protein (histidine phosphorylation site; PTS-related) [Paracholeplasma brassicae]|jgi:phosphocarrier protein|uniref:Phosphocarrier protein HPr n=1 Tax=Acholeplasma brassicae TaxID=61635 RepID=U4KT06_9MOLU|nr:HPr family phosphocarrier protein [Paracholeplasma brassicae]CCV65854.1 phosphocarrier protein (histidine phosphorylation site; PTS-related) [Paracholeplasma brassicae]HBT60051.1 HPr family phosphocarrier protein [Acholeplasmataceae bacterium]